MPCITRGGFYTGLQWLPACALKPLYDTHMCIWHGRAIQERRARLLFQDGHRHRHKDLADRIMNAEHACVVKRLSKDMAEDDRRTWEESNISVMKQLLTEKARTCEHFKQCLIISKDKVLAEDTGNKRWGTGLNARITERTKPNCWPGSNLMVYCWCTEGVLLMELTEELMHDTDVRTAMETQDDESAGSGDENSDSDEDISGTQQASSTGNRSNAGVIQNTQRDKSASEKKPKPSKSKKKTAPKGTNASTKDKLQSKDSKNTNKINPPIQ